MAFKMNSSFCSILRLSTASQSCPINLLRSCGMARKASKATTSSVDRLAKSLITFVSASSRLPVVNAWYLALRACLVSSSEARCSGVRLSFSR